VIKIKKILIVLDGGSGLPLKKFEGKTPLEIADTPNLDFFAEKGKMGYMYPIDEKTVPGSDNSLISLFGNNSKDCKRGVYEAIGSGINLKRGDLALRCNFGTISNLRNKKIIDRRAGRTLSTKEAKILAEELNKKINLNCKFEFKSSVQHRAVLVLRGGFSENISNVDPEWAPGTTKHHFKFSEPLDDEENSKHTANVLNDFLFQAYNLLEKHPINLKRKKKGLLPANFLFTRGGGVEKPKLKQYRTWMSINPMPLEIGISELSGMKTFSFVYPELKSIDAYQNLYKGLDKSIQFAIKTIKKQHKYYSGCYIQFKETDIPGHDNKPHEKKNMLEIIDKKFFGFLKKFIENKDVKVVVTCDHSTPCKLKMHSHHPVPVLVYNKKDRDRASAFNEKEAKKGGLGKMFGKKFIEKTGLNK
jgi:2,3-bisphosphoglycerate-independent phosphoglycerate mutase